ncbi:MAG: PEP-CTERM sorting domain-containing protein [Planctomycetes bacterium]|nr:PEP-CTERM sorting domain-containing protein [Planctomycetota bacterium]
MRRGKAVLAGACVAFIATGVPTRAATMDFSTVPAGTLYGLGQNNPGDVVLVENGIELAVDRFFLIEGPAFYRATVGGLYADLFPTNALELETVNAVFDFGGLPFPTNLVTFEFKEFSGFSNFQVNGGSLHQLPTLTAIPSAVAPGVSAAVSGGVVTLTGPIDTIRVGGQEVALDNITAVPEPATLVLLAAAGYSMRRLRRCRRR